MESRLEKKFKSRYYRSDQLYFCSCLCIHTSGTWHQALHWSSIQRLYLILNAFDVTLTLPGIAGIILGIGMAVDANVIIFARVREEMARGRSVKASLKSGFQKAMSAIVDGNVTTLIAAACSVVQGSGTVKGFAQTLAIGIVVSMFTALVITRMIVFAFYGIGIRKERLYYHM